MSTYDICEVSTCMHYMSHAAHCTAHAGNSSTVYCDKWQVSVIMGPFVRSAFNEYILNEPKAEHNRLAIEKNKIHRNLFNLNRFHLTQPKKI